MGWLLAGVCALACTAKEATQREFGLQWALDGLPVGMVTQNRDKNPNGHRYLALRQFGSGPYRWCDSL